MTNPLLSIIIPAYNEEKRIPLFLPGLLQEAKKLPAHEVIIVNDGSKDNTAGVVKQLIKGRKDARLLSLEKNQGKGGALQTSVFSAKGKYVLFIDADGSISPNEIPRMLQKLQEGYDVVVGDRSHPESHVDQSKLRHLTGVTFNIYTRTLFDTGMGDHLCGFKGFRREVARDLFKDLKNKRWVFDVELFYKIRKRAYSLYRLPIHWKHVGDSKISITDPAKMAWQLIGLRRELAKEN
ncbi:MAG TPA: dolichyl-phosphate beta-glucosyltransferase [Candidatus Norongarragalinales archaeon]|jgi:dolichyl-phosphate beta-glucosyltransferase|nr:dolichyl-phosphate beta-glucosyltransferase [Candidatus Norongarragalinales archaeon]